MKLSINERLELLRLLPEKGNLLTLRIVRDAQNQISFTAAEHNSIGFTHENGTAKWDTARDPHKNIDLPSAAIDILVAEFKRLTDTTTLTLTHLPLDERFMDKQ